MTRTGRPKMDRAEEGETGPVGYGRPPANHRFRKGQSGNPAGRAWGSRNRRPTASDRLGALWRDLLYRPVPVETDDKRLIEMPMAQWALQALFELSTKGDLKALTALLKIARTIEDDEAAIAEMVEEARAMGRDEGRYERDDNTSPVHRYVIVDPKEYPPGTPGLPADVGGRDPRGR